MIINHNIQALLNSNQLKSMTKRTETSIGKLSSGLRINQAADDSAGLAISEKMRAQIRGLDQALRNAQDGISLVDTAESALSQILNPPLQRMRELVLQANNDTLTISDRLAIQDEMDQLVNSINSVARNTHFNNKNLIDGSFSGRVSVLQEAEPANVFGSNNLPNSLTIVQGVNDTLNINVDGSPTSIQVRAGSYTASALITELNAQFKNNNVNVSVTYQNNQLILTHDVSGKDHTITNVTGNLVESLFLNVQPGQDYVGLTKASLTSKSNFSSAGYREITAGVNDTLSFTVDDVDYVINLTAGVYGNSEQLKNEINDRLIESGANVRFYSYSISGGTLAINQLQHTMKGDLSITNISGNAASTIFTYKNSDSWIIGNRNLSNGLTIIAGKNDMLNLKIDGNDYSIQLQPGTYSSSQLIDELNSHFSVRNIKLAASLQPGYSDEQLAVDGTNINVLRISRTTASTGDVNAIQFSGNAFTDLFLNLNKGTEIAAQPFKISGNADLTSGITVEEGRNDILKFFVDNSEFTIQLQEGTYTSSELLDELNNQINDNTVGVAASYENQHLVLTHNIAGENHKIHQFSGNALSSLFLYSKEGRDVVLSEAQDIQLQIGASAGNSVSIMIMDAQATALGIENVSIIDSASREGAIDRIDRAIQMVSSERSKMGAYQNGLEHTINNLRTSSQNLTEAESRIRDVDMAKEVMNQTRSSILSQAAQAMLAQANQLSQGVLQLLK